MEKNGKILGFYLYIVNEPLFFNAFAEARGTNLRDRVRYSIWAGNLLIN